MSDSKGGNQKWSIVNDMFPGLFSSFCDFFTSFHSSFSVPGLVVDKEGKGFLSYGWDNGFYKLLLEGNTLDKIKSHCIEKALAENTDLVKPIIIDECLPGKLIMAVIPLHVFSETEGFWILGFIAEGKAGENELKEIAEQFSLDLDDVRTQIDSLRIMMMLNFEKAAELLMVTIKFNANIFEYTTEKEQEVKAVYSELDNQRAHLQAIFNNLPYSAWFKDTEGRFVAVNEPFAKAYGISVEEILGSTDYDLVSDHLAREYEQKDKEVLALGRGMFFEGTGPDVTGALFYETFKAPILIGDEIVGISGISRDVTEIKLTTNLLNNKIEEQKAIFSSIPGYVFLKDLNHKYLSCNQAFADLHGVKDSTEVEGRMDEEFFEHETVTHFRETDTKVVQAGEGEYHLELKVKLNNGNHFWGMISKVPFYNEKGEVMGLAGTAFDITHRKRLERELIDANANLEEKVKERTRDLETKIREYEKVSGELNESENRWHTLYENLPGAVFLIDEDHKIEDVNDTLCQITGFSPEELLGKSCSMLCSKGPFKCPICQMGKSSVDNEESFILGKEGDFIPVLKSARKVQFGDSFKVLENFQDLTRIREVENKLKAAKEKAEEADRLKSAFLANMSHEIRTPLNGILGYTEILNDPDLDAETRKEYMRIINSCSESLLTLISDIIHIAQIESGQVALKMEDFLLEDFLKEQHSIFENLKSAKRKIHLDIRLNIPERYRLGMIRTDLMKLKQVLSNLLSNAIKFTEEGSVEFGYLLQEDGMIQFFVKDTGIGIHEDSLPLVFERFRQGDDSITRKYGGTGLGLSICQGIVALLGGSIWVESEVGRGSKFCFTIPYEASKSVGSSESMSVQRKRFSEQYDWSGKLILVADDEKFSFDFLRELIKPTGARVIYAADGMEALEECRNSPEINMVLMDLQMPRMNGFEATRKIKEFRPEMAIIAQTALAMTEEKEKSKQAGFDEYITKPINTKELLEKMDIFLIGERLEMEDHSHAGHNR